MALARSGTSDTTSDEGGEKVVSEVFMGDPLTFAASKVEHVTRMFIILLHARRPIQGRRSRSGLDVSLLDKTKFDCGFHIAHHSLQ